MCVCVCACDTGWHGTLTKDLKEENVYGHFAEIECLTKHSFGLPEDQMSKISA